MLVCFCLFVLLLSGLSLISLSQLHIFPPLELFVKRSLESLSFPVSEIKSKSGNVEKGNVTDPTCQAGVRDGVTLMSFPPASSASIGEMWSL